MAESEQSLAVFRTLVDAWTTEATHRLLPSDTILGRTTFEWLDGEQFLIMRAHYDHPEIPDAISLIGDTGGLRMHYFDTRGVARLYETSFDGNVWTYSRTAPDSFSPLHFKQRFAGTLSDDGRTIAGRFQICEDEDTWVDDLQITYRRDLRAE